MNPCTRCNGSGTEPKAQLDPEFPATWGGGHGLIVEFGDEEFWARCQCGEPFGNRPPSASLDFYAQAWERHVMCRSQT